MATLETRLRDLSTRIGTECKAIRTLLNNNTADNAALLTTAKGNLIAAVNEVRQLALDAAAQSGAEINDAATNTTEAWSSQKISDEIVAAINALATGAPAALDTLNELAAALNDDPNAITALTTAVGNRLRFDTAQTLTAPQKVQANANMGSLSLADTGNPDTDFVAVFNTALA